MLLLVTYDVKTETSEGRRRLAKVAKICGRYGQRVQNSVFECNVDWTQSRKLEAELVKLIKQDEDSLRFYNLGDNYHNRVAHIGVKLVLMLTAY
jgi:CRISPR-associated protein, Cas2 family